MAQKPASPIEKLTSHYEKTVMAVVEATKVTAIALKPEDVAAIEAACARWVQALHGVLRVRDTIMEVIGEKYEEETNIEIPATTTKEDLV